MEIFFADINNFPKIKGSKKEKEHTLGRWIVNYAAVNFYKISDVKIGIKNKKPYFENSDLEFNISHSENLVIAAFDKNPVGADIEYMKKRDFPALAKRYNFECGEDDYKKFYSFWTNYEAKIKLQDEVKSRITFLFKDEYIVSAASSIKQDIKNNLKIYECKMPDVSTPSLINIPDEYILSSS